MKRFLAGVLALVMLLCCVPAIAYAAETDEQVQRYTVLVLDTSSSSTFIGSGGQEIYTADTAIEYVKKASSRFLDNISGASGDNYVAVVSYKDSATTVSNFTQDYDVLKNKINNLYASSNTRSIASGLEYANTLLQDITDEKAIKNVVLFTTGMTNAGDYSYSGQYDENTVGSSWHRTDTQVRLYAYANSACAQADLLKEKDIGVYTIGLFQTMEQMPEEGQDVVSFFKLTANDLATSDDYYYPVDDPDNLEFTFGEVADDIVNQLKKITFTYQSGKDYTATCYYTNDYFTESAYTYNPSLATMSLSFAMSAFGSSKGGQSDYSNKSVNAKQLLMDIGVPEANIQTNDWFTQKPTTDSIGVVVGNMPITVKGEDYTLIALAVRGGGYESEWASNFTIGISGQHNGFNTAKNNVLDYLKTYVEEQNITGAVKFWITGYSRAAATANLVGGAIDNGAVISTDISYAYDDIYTYCFETPAGALTADVKGQAKYNNIFNIINSSDPVPYVAPAAMGFGRYGIDHYLPSQESSSNYASLKAKMLNIYNGLDSTEGYIVDDFQMKKLEIKNWLPGGEKISFVQDDTENNYSQGLFLSNYVTILAKEFIGSRDNYVSAYQDEIREICSVMFGCTDEQSKKLMDSLVSQAKNEWGDLAWSYVWNVGVNPWGSEDDALQIVSNWLKKAVNDAGITNYNEATIDAAGKDLADLLLALVANHPNYFTTAIMNGSGLGAAHYPELCYSWLASMDNNYTEGARVEFNNGGYRIVRINCAVDVTVYDNNGNKIASIENEQPNTELDSSYIYGVDEDGQKYIVLPVDSDFDISITGREDDLVNYSISEYSALAGDYTRNINYFDIDLKQGETLSGTIPSYSDDEIENDTPNGSNAAYTLLDPNDNPIQSDSDKSGVAVSQDVYNVNVVSSNPKHGVVSGSGAHQYGTFAQVEAIALEGYQFVGWYRENNLVSTDAMYRICVTEDIDLVGKFEETTCPHNNTEIRGELKESCSDGYTGDTYCKDCGEKVSTGHAIPGAHKLNKVDATSATHEKAGNIEYYICSVCGKLFADNKATTEISKKETVIPQVQHQYGDTYEYDADYHWKKCECGTIAEKGAHSYGEWVITKPETTSEKGIKEKTCNICGHKITEEIPVAIETPDDNNPNGDVSGNSPQTGDNSNIFLWVTLLVLSSIGLLVAIILGKKKVNS